MEIIDIDNVSSLQTHLSNLTGLSLSVYGEKGNIILPPVTEDKFLSAVRLSSVGGGEYDDFLIKHTGNAVQRKNVSIVRGPAGQHYFFIPVHAEGSVFVITGSGIYLSGKDFEDFYKSKGESYGFLPHQFKSWSQEIIVRDYPDIQNTARHIQSLFNLVIGESFEGSLNEKRYRLMKTIFSLISDIKLDKQADEIHDILLDVLTFLFNADSVSIMIRDDNVFRPRRVAGRLKEHLQSLSLKSTGIVSEVVEKRSPYTLKT